MVSDEAWDWFTHHRGRVILGCVSPLLVCLAVAGSLWVWNEWRVEALRQRVARSVRASFPSFCAAPGERLLINNALVRSSPSLVSEVMWDVSCLPGQGEPPWPWPAMTVNLATCEVTTPMDISLKWYDVYGRLFTNGQRMTICP
jgi:hypothetical protein